MIVKRSVFLFVCFFMIVGAVHAQRLTGSIKGQVADENGAALPGVSVTILGDALIGGPQISTTSAEGGYRFPALPPGAYKLTYTLEGFQTVVHDQVRVVLGTTIEENVTMNLAKVSEEMVITGQTPLVDPTKAGFSTNFTQENLKNTPIARFTFFDFVQMAPGSSPMRFDNTAFAHSILGSNTNENMYQMDGTDLTAPLTGAAWPWPNTDVIDEIEILDLGAPAEYGNYQGGVVNVVTKSGGNEFHGDGNVYFQSQGLTGENVAVIDPTSGKEVPYHRSKYLDGTFQIGGPIKKDKLWFFAGLQSRREHFSEPGTDPNLPKEEDDDRIFFKGTWDINQKNKLQFSLHNDYYNIPGSNEPVSFKHPFDVSLKETGNNPTPNVMWSSTLNDKAFLEVRYAGFYGKDHGLPLNGQYVSGHYDSGSTFYSGGILSWYDGTIWKSQVSGKLSYYADNFIKGNHDFRFGVQYTKAGTDYIYAYTNGVKYYDYNGPAYAYFQTPYHTGADVTSTGLFVDDTWNLNESLTFNLGVRFDRSTGSIPDFPLLNTAGEEIEGTVKGLGRVANWNVVSPRLGLTYHFPWKMATQIRGHYGRYYQALLTPYIRNRSRIEGKSFNPDIGSCATSVTSACYDELTFVSDPSQFTIDANLKDPYTDQFAIGLDRQLAPDLALSASFIYKRSHDFIGTINTGATYERVSYVDPVTGQVFTVFNQTNNPATDNRFLITNPDFFFEKYRGFLVSVTKRMSRKWEMTASLTISKTEGFDAGSGLGPFEDQDSSFFNLANAVFGQDNNDFINASGLLNGDRKYIFKLQSTYELPWAMRLSGNYSALTGRPYAGQIVVPGSDQPEGVLDQGNRTIFAEKRDGSRRTSNISLLDLRLEKNFYLGKSLDVAFTADLFNVFNSAAFYDVATTLSNEADFGQGSVFVPPRRLMLGAKLKF